MKEKDQEKALAMIDGDPGLHGLRHLRAPYLDLEVSRCVAGTRDSLPSREARLWWAKLSSIWMPQLIEGLQSHMCDTNRCPFGAACLPPAGPRRAGAVLLWAAGVGRRGG